MTAHLLAVDTAAPTTQKSDMSMQTMMNFKNEHLPALQQSLDTAQRALDRNDTKAAADALRDAQEHANQMQTAMKSWSAGAGKDMGSMHFANSRCPMGDNRLQFAPSSDMVIRDYKGQKLAFCGSTCATAWDQLSETQKDAKLKAAGMDMTQFRGSEIDTNKTGAKELAPTTAPSY